MLDDKWLLWRLQRGDRNALRQIYEQYHDALLTLAATMLDDPGRAEDVLQDVFVTFAQSAHRLRIRGSLRAYLATAVANRVKDRYRRRRRERLACLDDAAGIVAHGETPVQMMINSEQMQRLRAVVNELPYEQREVLMLRVHADMKFREIARHQGVSLKTVMSRYRYGLDKLRSMLNGEVLQ